MPVEIKIQIYDEGLTLKRIITETWQRAPETSDFICESGTYHKHGYIPQSSRDIICKALKDGDSILLKVKKGDYDG